MNKKIELIMPAYVRSMSKAQQEDYMKRKQLRYSTMTPEQVQRLEDMERGKDSIGNDPRFIDRPY